LVDVAYSEIGGVAAGLLLQTWSDIVCGDDECRQEKKPPVPGLG
jgi:hypothetical protein